MTPPNSPTEVFWRAVIGKKQVNRPSLHRSQILRDLRAMQALIAELFGFAEKFRCSLQRRI
jgi:hypothetical protein